MRNNFASKTIMCVLLVACFTTVLAQVKPMVTGLGGNKEYMDFLTRERTLRLRDDSIANALEVLRIELRAAPENRSKYSSQILSMESQLFEVRTQIGMLTSQINAIEQDYVLKNLDGGAPPLPIVDNGTVAPHNGVKGVADLVKNTIFQKNLAPQDYETLLAAQAKESLVLEMLNNYRENYRTMTTIESQYPREKDPTKADSLYSRYDVLNGINNRISDSVSSVWSYVSDNKTYIYSYLLEKMNKTNALTYLQKATSEQHNIENANAGKYSSDAVAFYSLRKSLLLDFELRIAEIGGLQLAKDSLSNARMATDTVSYTFEPIDMKERMFISFANVSVSPGKYGSGRPIPTVETHKRGVIYRIQIGTMVKMQPVSLFRNLYPLSYQRGDDGRYRYFAGCYSSVEQAVADIAVVKRAGFKDAFVVSWQAGVYKSLGQISTSSKAGLLYRVEIDTQGKSLSSNVQAVINSTGKELTKVGNTIVVGNFDTQVEAQLLMSTLRETNQSVSVKVTEIEN